jgi:hypothetical protein
MKRTIAKGIGDKGVYFERLYRGLIGLGISRYQLEIHLWNISIYFRWKKINAIHSYINQETGGLDFDD